MRARLGLLSTAALACLCLLASTSGAEYVQAGKLLVSFDATLAPTKLPRHEAVPVKVGFSGSFENLDASDTPALRTMVVRLAEGGVIDSRGVPRCAKRALENTTSAEALGACARAKVGEGTVRSAFRFPDGRRGRATARMLLFNARGGMLMHVHATEPLEGTFLVPMSVRRRGGAELLRASFPRIAAGYGYLTGFEMRITRRGYARASCAIPEGFGRKIRFELARVTYRFEGGTAIDNSALRSCRVKGP